MLKKSKDSPSKGEKNISEPFDCLYSVSVHPTTVSSWKNWIMYMLDAVEKTAILTNNLIEEIISQMEATLVHGKKLIRWYNKEVNEAIFSQPYIKSQVIIDILGKSSRTTVAKYMSQLVDAQILTPKKDGVEVYFLNDDLLRILQG